MAHPRWLDEDQQRTWRAFLAANRLVFERVERQLQADAGMPQAYYEILARLSEAPDRTLRMSLLATSSLSSRSRVSHAVARMEEAGWIRRRSCPTDRRGQLAALTDEGMQVLRETAPGHVGTVQEVLFDALSPEQQRMLREVGETLVTHLSADPQWPVDGDAGPDGPQPVVTGEYRLGDVRHVTAASERIRSELGWHAEVDFEAGMRDFATAPLRSAVQ